jgi:sulfide:quinone oxidoreductase
MTMFGQTVTGSRPAVEGSREDRFRVVIAGGGVAALEAVMALHDLASGELDVQLIAADPDFTLQALSVASPFGGEDPPRLALEPFCRDHAAHFRADQLTEVWAGGQRVLTGSGEDIFYDALLLATGARRHDALPGAQAFRGAVDVAEFESALGELRRGGIEHLAFAVPEGIRWSLPLYELALLTARRLDASGGSARLTFVTGEHSPLDACGSEVGERVTGLLAKAGIELLTGSDPIRYDGHRLLLDGGEDLPADRVITLPGLSVPEIPGIPQGRGGFLDCDPGFKVDGLNGVWAAGDMTWFPIKQGGLAAQQAEVAATGIARAAGIDVEPEPFRPIIRGAMITGDEPQFIRADLGNEGATEVATSPLWWPPIKVAGRRLAPYLAREWGGEKSDPLIAMDDLETGPASETEHREALALSLNFADTDAREGDFDHALRWLDVAERLNLTLPERYEERRREWRGKVDRS